MRQKIRKTILISSFLLFPITIWYFSPCLIIQAASEHIMNGSFIVFSLMLVLSMLFGRIRRRARKGYVLYYTNQCPFNAKYVPVVEKTAKEYGIPFRAVKIDTREDARNAPTPVTTYALFHDGEYITNEQMNDKKFLKLAGK